MNKTIILGAGCFWGTQAYFDLIKGIVKTTVGYANGNSSTVTYAQVCKGDTGFIEVCKIEYDSNTIDLANILNHFWQIVDPLSVDKQANDIGHQYQSAILYDLEDQSKILSIILKSKELEQTKYQKPIMTLIEPLKNFVEAEEYHQKYLQKNPNGYCHIRLPKT